MFKTGEVVKVVALGAGSTENYTDGEDILGQTFTVLSVDEVGYIKINHYGGWWVRHEALAHTDGKTSVEGKIAFMDKRFKERNNV